MVDLVTDKKEELLELSDLQNEPNLLKLMDKLKEKLYFN